MPDHESEAPDSTESTQEPTISEHPNSPTEHSASEPKKRPARRGSRGGQRKRSGSTSTRAASVTESSDNPELPDIPNEGVPRTPKIGDTRPPPLRAPATTITPTVPDEPSAIDDSAPAVPSPKRRRRRGGRRPNTASQTDTDSSPEVREEWIGRERKGRPVGRYLMCVHVDANTTQIAVLEGRSLIEHYVSRYQDETTQIDGNIYFGRVQNVLPGMEAAFVDIGTPKNAVLYRGDLRYDTEDLVEGNQPSKQANLRIEQLLKSGQSIICQVTKNPIGTKGARLTQEVSLPGRFVVLVPNSTAYGISRRLPDDERRRLRQILDAVKPKNHGLIIRTAAIGATEEELHRDVNRLLDQWKEIETKVSGSKAPALLYGEPDMAVRIIREEFNRDYRGVLIDDPELAKEVKEYVEDINPSMADRVELYDEPLPIFERHHILEQVHKATDRKVWLPSGGSLVIDRTEALTVIDVNTGKNVGKSNLEETVYRNNLEAAEEIARQLRLRDIGGIIVIDYIDMEIKENRDDLTRVFRDALARDKTRTQVSEVSDLGLVEMTRKRISEGLVESLSETCSHCGGRGILFHDSMT